MTMISPKRDAATSDLSKTLAQLKRFWKARGGWPDLWRSPYLWLSVVLLIPTAHMWLYESWWYIPISVLPNLLGFSLGGYAILLAFGDDRFKVLLAWRDEQVRDGGKPTIFATSSAVFLHFILVQLVALIMSVVAKSLAAIPHLWFSPARIVVGWLAHAGSCIGFFLFLYAIAMAGAAALSVFGLGEMFEDYLADKASKSDKEKGQ